MNIAKNTYSLFLASLLLLLLTVGAWAQSLERYDGTAGVGGKRPVTGGVTSTNTLVQSIGGATVTIYLQGTLTLASIYTDRTGVTPKANPFTADATTGYFFFYADTSRRYDVQFSGGTSPNNLLSPVVLADQVVPITANFSIPSIPTTGLLAEYRFDDGSGTTLTDYSGNNFNGTLVNSPAWSNGGLTFTRSSAQRVSLPSGLSANVRSVVVISTNLLTDATGQTVALVGNSSATQGLRLMQNYDAPSLDPGKLATVGVAGGTSFTANDTIGFNTIGSVGPEMLSVVLDASNDTLYIGPNALNGYKQRFGHNSGTYLVNNLQLGGDVTFGYYQGTIHYALFYSTALTQQQIVQIYEAVRDKLRARGVNIAPPQPTTSTPNVLAAVGDSLTSGAGGTSYVPSLTPTDTFTTYNLGVHAKTAQQLAFSAPSIQTLYLPQAKRNVVLLWAGTNDVCAFGRTSEQTITDLRAISDRLRAQGWKVVLATMISRSGCDAVKNTLNGLIRAQWKQFADDLADVASNANIGADGAFANGTYFTDGIHLTAAGASIVAGFFNTSLNTTLPTLGDVTLGGIDGNVLYRTGINNLAGVAGSAVTALGELDFNSTVRTSGGSVRYFRVRTPADTGLTADTESIGIQLGGNSTATTVTRQFTAGGGTFPFQAEVVIPGPTYGATSAETIPQAATLDVRGIPIAGTNMTITQALAARLNGKVFFGGTLVGSQNENSELAVDATGLAGYPAFRFNFHPTGQPSQLGIIQGGQPSQVGTRDVIMGLVPDTTSGYALFQGFGAAGTRFRNENNTNSLFFDINSTEKARITNSSELYLGGVSSVSPAVSFVRGPGGNGTDNAGANLVLSGGAGTGAGARGRVTLRPPLTQASGTTQQSLTTVDFPVSANFFIRYSPVVTVAATTTETSLRGTAQDSSTDTIPAGFARVGQIYTFTSSGTLTTTAATPTLQLRIRLGATQVCNTGAVTLKNNGGNTVTWSFQTSVVVTVIGASGTTICMPGMFIYSSSFNGDFTSTFATTTDTTTGINFNGALQWDFTSQFSTTAPTITSSWLKINLDRP